ncbi:threonine--tRNA ligase [Roseococcus sp. SDR]|uniref:threonine--tRNA ligase n=1 Tax=Roseococcus sp. SDR TaxID=2835532 RepID=UPI001BD11E38|nr:threonine--tRNA ligase [Roseococcus sp. SDR]MBS7790464.1 threonine--tRNA ligase [Roseococcus sp. SDR]MBV1845778.1 threonine--tRNA ligase [Roseococcus sp. SDR]
MPAITLPDGSLRQFDGAVTGTTVAASIGPGLAKAALAMVVNGEMMDLSREITADASLRFITRKDPEALELIRHDAAHVLAEAVQELFPGTQVTIGPAIENGFYYDFSPNEPFTPEDFPVIEAKMREIIARNAAFTREVWPREQAIEFFEKKGERYKAELIRDLPADVPISIYRQGDWLDLCRGPHMPSTGAIGSAFKLMKVAGAYWRGDHRNAMLSRIYATAWRDQKELDAHLLQLEEAERRDHRGLGQRMDLFHFQSDAPGAVFWHPRGWKLFSTLIDYMRRRQEAAGYLEINTPDIMDRGLWEKSGHWDKFRDAMYLTEAKEDRVFALKPMNCPGGIQVFKQGLRSYRELPLKLGEFGKVHRFEPSGALQGLMRVRAFTQDDAHVFCTEAQMQQECVKIIDLCLSIYKDFGFEDVRIKLSDRPEKRVGTDEIWDRSEAALHAALMAAGIREYSVNKGEGAFYGPKLEFVLRDAMGRDWQCGTLQVDFNMPGALGASYIGEDSQRHVPVMLHRALFGSLERFTGILIEHTAGRLPLWLAPQQVVVASIVDDAAAYAESVARQMRAAGLRAEADTRNEKINRKVVDHIETNLPVLAVVGRREAEEGMLVLRRLPGREQETLPLAEAVALLAKEATPPDLRAESLQTVAA